MGSAAVTLSDLDPYRLWAQQLFMRARQLSGLDRRNVGETLAQMRERDNAFRRQTVADWEDGITEGSLANFLALCRLAGLEPGKVLSLVENEEAAHEQASHHPLFKEPVQAPVPLAPTADAAGGGRRRRRGPRLYVIGGGLLAALMLFMAAVTHSPNPAVWLGAMEVWASQSAPIHRVYAGVAPTPGTRRVTSHHTVTVTPTPSSTPTPTPTATPTPTPPPTAAPAPAAPAPAPVQVSSAPASVSAQVPPASVSAQVSSGSTSVTAQVPPASVSASVSSGSGSVTAQVPSASVSAQVPPASSPSVSVQASTPPLPVPLPAPTPSAGVGVQVNLP